MKWFKFDWFTSKEREDIKEVVTKLQEETKAINERIQDLVKLKEEKQDEQKALGEPQKAYQNLLLSGDMLTVVLGNGVVITKTATPGLFQKVKDAATEAEILTLLTEMTALKSKPQDRTETQEQIAIVRDNLGVLRNHPDFVVDGDKVILKGVSLQLPPAVAATFIEILEKKAAWQKGFTQSQESWLEHLTEQYEALKMFWIKLALNGLEQSRNDLLRFVRENDVRITSNGNLVLYRRIVSLGGKNKKLIEFVSQEYYRIKKQKKGPGNYAVYSQADGTYVSDTQQHIGYKYIGNLKEMYLELPEMADNTYTSAHNRGQLQIKIGGIYKIDDTNINLDNGLCAAGGLHAAAVDYNYSGFGDTPVVVLVNPSKAITVPLGEIGKLRTTEMFIACINDKPQGQHFDEDALSAFDEEYNNLSIAELEDAISNKSFKIASVEDNVSPLSFKDLENIRDMLSQRVIQIA